MSASKLTILLLMFFLTHSVYARMDIATCWASVSKDANNYPMQVDKVTTIIGTLCREEKGRVIYVYEMRLDTQLLDITPNYFAQLKSEALNMGCTNPSIAPLLKLVDMEYAYHDITMRYIGRYTLRIEECQQ